MTMARRTIVDEESEGVYHCTIRSVRRAFLCGKDRYSGKDYSHRKQWVRDRLEWLSKAFAIDVLAYSVMCNHVHTVVQNRPDLAAGWSAEDVARRWLTAWSTSVLATKQRMAPTQAQVDEIVNDAARVSELRRRLSSISWFMKMLNEFIARRANQEDECTGRFWEGRFKSQRLLDEAAVLTCMVYVDLNPVRARMVNTLTDPQFTSAYERIQTRQAREHLELLQDHVKSGRPLTPAQQAIHDEEMLQLRRGNWLFRVDAPGSPLTSISEEAYLELLDWTGREVRADKPGCIPPEIAPILTELQIRTERWVSTVNRYGSLFYHVAGSVERIAQAARSMGRRWLCGMTSSRQVFGLTANTT